MTAEKISPEKMKRKLINAVREHMLNLLEEKIPDEGIFKPYSARMAWPGTEYVAWCIIEYEYSAPGRTGRYVRLGMSKRGSDRLISHYLLNGDKYTLIYWFKSERSASEMLSEYESLKLSVDSDDD